MPSSYSGNPAASDKDAVRFLIQDTGPAAFDITDEEIAWLLETEGNYWMASAVLCDKLTTIKSSGGLSSKSVGGLSESYSQGSIEFYSTQAKVYRARGSAGAPLAATVPQFFTMKQFDKPGVADPRAPSSFALSWRSEEESED